MFHLGPGTIGRINLRKFVLQNEVAMACMGLLRVKPRAAVSHEKALPEAVLMPAGKNGSISNLGNKLIVFYFN